MLLCTARTLSCPETLRQTNAERISEKCRKLLLCRGTSRGSTGFAWQSRLNVCWMELQRCYLTTNSWFDQPDRNAAESSTDLGERTQGSNGNPRWTRAYKYAGTTLVSNVACGFCCNSGNRSDYGRGTVKRWPASNTHWSKQNRQACLGRKSWHCSVNGVC